VTLIVSYCDHNCIIQASDRRLTAADGSIVVDHQNKAVLVCNRATIALTGLAQLGVDRTSPLLENWIVTALTKHGVTTISGACKALKAEAVQAFNLLSVPREQRGVAFAVAGWSILEPGSEARATIACVSNAFHWGENRWDALASDQFRWEYLHLHVQLAADCWIRRSATQHRLGNKIHPVGSATQFSGNHFLGNPPSG
jgi:hypothetical protein